ncbi:venom serine protease inhibitor-like [Anopheles aquasalis]|uniref:venom serine protease inhibitor-like n=1 Tax=Anopheles aquasalis TaxID=42839 RepID=UPI00215A1E4B|nr:venom serine protease inhibitor-like [Anopheles aquasalis]
MRAVLSIFVLLAVICTLFVPIDAITCKYGEEHKCSNKACERTCGNIGTDLVCDVVCTNGCYCADGFVRVSYDRCKPDFICQYMNVL